MSDIHPSDFAIANRDAEITRLRALNAELVAATENLIDKLEVMGGCNEHDMNGENPFPEFVAARAALEKAKQT